MAQTPTCQEPEVPVKHPTIQELADAIWYAEQGLEIGSHFRHYRNNKVYEIVLISAAEATGEILVSYRCTEYDDTFQHVFLGRPPVDARHVIHTRPVKEFLEEVPTPFGSQRCRETVPRFTKVKRMECWVDEA